ncbi:hypothetical protein GCM10025868_13250 [Angustibacter aerolatus]|uniref:Uncharacterized protein n=1 Tax=Angustibacter aerolatus TaxID=1162965 RepID=A0ABQ6JFT6_9ACTN|nr:hypothetical protein [Angustibacter aerolatus]GMA86075.1 hypothetical protein GCM10025868_13250 [Angustibacter aerolatus]
MVVGDGRLGDEGYRGYLVIQTPSTLERYERYVAPAAALVDEEAAARIGARWAVRDDGPPYAGPVLVVAGRLDATVGWAAAAEPGGPAPARGAGGAGRRGARPAARAARGAARAAAGVAAPRGERRLTRCERDEPAHRLWSEATRSAATTAAPAPGRGRGLARSDPPSAD